MRLNTIFKAIGISILLVGTTRAHAQWTTVGSAGFSAGGANTPSLDIDGNDDLYIGYRDAGNSGNASVMKYSGSSWTTVGSAGFSAGEATYTSLKVGKLDTPYFAYKDAGNSNKATVMKYNGSSWVNVGSAGFSAGEANFVSMIIDTSGAPCVAYKDMSNSAKATVMRYDGSSWVALGGAGFSAGAVNNIVIGHGKNDTLYVAFRDDANSNYATVMKYNGSSWGIVGSAGFSAGSVIELAIAFDNAGTPYVSYRDIANAHKATVMKYNGSSWVNVGSAGFSPGSAYLEKSSLAIDASGTPYIGFRDGGNGNKLSVMSYNGSSWTPVGGSYGVTSSSALYPTLAFNSLGDLFVGYQDLSVSSKVSVQTYDLPSMWNGNSWVGGVPTSTVDAAIASSTAVSADFSCKDLTINSGVSLNTGTSRTITIHGDVTNSGDGFSGHGTVVFAKSGTASLGGDTLDIPCTMTVSSGCTLTTNGLLRLKSSASDTGRIGNSAGVISGDVICERYIPGRRAFRFLAHPFSTSIPLSQLTDDIDVTGQGGATNGFTLTSSNNPSAFSWEINGTGAWQAYTSALTNSWDQYEHLRIMIRGAKGEGLGHGSYTPSAVTLDMHGPINQGTHTITLEAGTNSPYFAQGGNPFPCAVALSTVTKGADVGSTIYLWNPQAATNGAYASQPFGVPFKLAAYSSFHATLSGSADTDVEFEEADKTTKGISYFKPTATGNYWVELVISDSTHFWDKLFLNFNDKSMDVQDKEDGIKHMNPNMDFYVSTSDDVDVAVDSRPYKDGKSIPLGLRAYVNYGTYVIRVGYFDIAKGTKLYLHDKFLNKKEEITPGMEYWFAVTTDSNSQGKNRFEVNMKGQPLTGLGEEVAHASKVQLIPNPARNEAKVSFEELEGNVKVTLLSVTGNVLYMKESNSRAGSISIPLNNLPSGVYMVHLESDNASFTEKLIKE